jgi:hypothetical protein
LTNKKLLPAEEQPCNQSPDYTAFEAIRKGLGMSGIEHDDWDFIANKVFDCLKDAGIAGILKAQRAEEACFILPNGQTTGRIFADHHQEAYKPVISVQEIKHLVRYIDCSADIRTIFHIHGERDRASAEEIARAIETRLRGHAMTGGHCYHNSTHWFSLDVPEEDVEYIVFYTPEEVSQ